MELGAKKILVVEDNAVMSDIIRFNLERAGFDVVACANGAEAADLLDRETVDLIVTDLQMPVMSGDELCRQVRRDPRHQGVPILVVSAKGFEFDLDTMIQELSLSAILFKPFSPKEVVDSVRTALAEKTERDKRESCPTK